jgi:hypothetical protein
MRIRPSGSVCVVLKVNFIRPLLCSFTCEVHLILRTTLPHVTHKEAHTLRDPVTDCK